MPLAEVWGLEGLTGPPRAILDFVSGIYIFSGAHQRPMGRRRRTRSAT